MIRNIIYSEQGETIDAIAFRIYGKTAGMTEALLKLNRGLEKFVILPTHTEIKIPTEQELPNTQNKEILQLWD